VTVDKPRVQISSQWQKAGQSAPAQILNSLPLDNMIRVVTVVQQFMTQYNDAVSKEAKIQAISKIVLTFLEQNDSRVHRPLTIIAFNANGIGRQRHELGKQLQDLTTVTVRKGIPHNHVDLPALISVEATGACIPVVNDVVLLAAVYKSPGWPWNNTDILKLLGFKEKTILAGDLNAKHPFWNSSVSNPSGVELLELFHKNEFKISAPQCPTH
jgi:hypothetical protein